MLLTDLPSHNNHPCTGLRPPQAWVCEDNSFWMDGIFTEPHCSGTQLWQIPPSVVSMVTIQPVASERQQAEILHATWLTSGLVQKQLFHIIQYSIINQSKVAVQCQSNNMPAREVLAL